MFDWLIEDTRRKSASCELTDKSLNAAPVANGDVYWQSYSEEFWVQILAGLTNKIVKKNFQIAFAQSRNSTDYIISQWTFLSSLDVLEFYLIIFSCCHFAWCLTCVILTFLTQVI